MDTLPCCYKAFSTIPELYAYGSTGGVATTLAYSLLKTGEVKGVLVSRRYETFIAKNLRDLLDSCGSIYEEFRYYKPRYGCEEFAQIGKPCNIDARFNFSISLFCSSIYAKQKEPISKKKLRKLSSTSRYVKALKHKPWMCRKCRDHLGVHADICVGDSQTHRKRNHVIVQSEEGFRIWNETVNQGWIIAKPISLKLIHRRQPYLWGEVNVPWMVKKFLKRS